MQFPAAQIALIVNGKIEGNPELNRKLFWKD